MITNNYSYFLNQLLIGSRGRRYFFDARITDTLKPLVLVLQKLNLIRRFYKFNESKQLYRIFPSYSRYRRHTRSIQTYSRKRGRIVLNVQALRLISKNTPHSHYVLETNKGVMTHKDALRFNIGGLLLLIVH